MIYIGLIRRPVITSSCMFGVQLPNISSILYDYYGLIAPPPSLLLQGVCCGTQ